MGWFNDNMPDHEGYVIGLVRDERGETWSPDGHRLRRLTTGDVAQPVPFVQVSCDCGWRSRVFTAPIGAEFFPSICVVNERAEERAIAIWKLHATTDAIGGVL